MEDQLSLMNQPNMIMLITSNLLPNLVKRAFQAGYQPTEDAIRQNPQLLEFESKIHQLKEGNGTTSQITAAENKAHSYQASLTQKSLQQ